MPLNTETPKINIHKTFSDIESDMKSYYTSKIDALDFSLKTAGRSLRVAAYLHGGDKIAIALRLINEVLVERANENTE